MNTPRRPLVPGPTPRVEPTPGGLAGGVAERAIALREQQAQRPRAPQTNGQPPTPAQTPGGLAPVFRTPVGQIAGAIAAVMSKIDTIEKRGRNEYFGYAYARMEDVLYAVTPLMGQNGLAVIQNEVSKEVLEGSRLACTYEFSIFHSSGEVWPEKPRFTGVSLARDRKGNWDDKAVNKCHTTARKYFLLALFQVPAGDFPDADEDNANQRNEKAPVPGPSQRPAQQTPAQADVDDSAPHKIVLPQGSGPDQWAGAYIKAIGRATSVDDMKAWDSTNDKTLQQISEQYPGVYETIETAAQRRLMDISVAAGMPDPKVDVTAAMNWVGEQLAQLRSLETAEAFWNEYVAPREAEFMPPDWQMLIEEWDRTEQRINPPDDDPPAAA
jgi:ERF superfamily